jgi:acetate kinase
LDVEALMTQKPIDVLTLNCGSSSLKYATFSADAELSRATIGRIGAGGPPDHAAAVATVFQTLTQSGAGSPAAVGHRIVHGGPDHLTPARVDDTLLASLERAIPFAPLHLPAELSAIRAVRTHFGDLPQVVCFDTGFHRALPEIAQRFALPRALCDAGIRRYGFHGLSYEFIVESLGNAALRRAVIAHLGNGASMVAVRDGASIDTTMGFTPTAGLVMGTRSGDLDPGLLVHLLDQRGYDARGLERLVNHEAGLLALSETTSDMQALLAQRDHDRRAALAVEVFCYQAKKWIGALAATLGGIDALVFTGGIGEHAAEVRRGICAGLDHLGVSIDDSRNQNSAAIISADASRCQVRVIATNEERMIARHTRRILAHQQAR